MGWPNAGLWEHRPIPRSRRVSDSCLGVVSLLVRVGELSREKIAAADGVLFGTAEHNYSLSGVQKNGTDHVVNICPPTQYRCHACPRATACRVVCNLRAGVVFVPFVLAAAAIDWASRTLAGKSNSFAGKAGGVIGSGGGTGAAKASIHLRDICVFLNVHLLQKPEVCVAPRHVALWQGWGMGGISRSAPGVPPSCVYGGRWAVVFVG